MYSKRQNSKQKSSQKRLKSSGLFSECQKVIGELQTQLQHALKINEQKDQMIKMLTQQKQYYMNEAKAVADKKYSQMKQQINWNNSLISGLKKHNKEIAEKYQKLVEQNAQMSEQLKFKQELLHAQSIEIQKIKIEKDRIQSQWNRTLLSVKQKIIQLYRSNQIKNQVPKKPVIKNQKVTQKQVSKELNYKKISQTQSLSLKVQNILNQLDQKIISYQVQDLIKSQCFENKGKSKPVMNQICNLNEFDMIYKKQNRFCPQDINMQNFLIENKQNLCINSNTLE